MTPLFLLAATATATPSLLYDERYPAVGVILTSRARESSWSVSSLRAVLDRVLRSSGPLELRPDDPALESCLGRPACIVRSVRDALALNTSSSPVLLVIIAVTSDDGILPRVYDLPKAIEAASIPTDDLDSLDAAINRAALLGRPPYEHPADERALEAYIARVIAPVTAALETQGRIAPLARVSLKSPIDGATIDVDGKTVGTTSKVISQHLALRAGLRTVVISHPAYSTFQQKLELRPADTVELDVTLIERDPPFVFPHATIWPAVSVSAVGAVLIAVGAAQASAPAVTCPARPSGV